MHAFLVLSVIVIEDTRWPWCVGDGDEIPGNWTELERAA
jgi:hypothetical protein